MCFERIGAHKNTYLAAFSLSLLLLIPQGVIVFTSMGNMQEATESKYDRNIELKAFDDSKLGVKGLVDAGLTKVPRIFIHPQHNVHEKSGPVDSHSNIPIIDLQGVKNDATVHATIISQVQKACENWGTFQIVNHGISGGILKEMIEGIRRFHEQDSEVKKEYYTRDMTKKVIFLSNFDLFQAPSAFWRDTLLCIITPNPPDPIQVPSVCRDVVVEYLKQVKNLGYTLLELLSEALGLEPDHLKNMEFVEQGFFLGQYYPSCPEPELTLGTRHHTDPNFLTIILQDQLGGLQILHENHWMDVPPIPGGLVINAGDVLQIVTNGRFKSVEHRVLAQHEGPRISVSSFFNSCFPPSLKVYTPIKELLSEENPPNDN